MTVQDTAGSGDSGRTITTVAGLLPVAYGLFPRAVEQGPCGTATRNYVATDRDGARWFIKTYPTGTARGDEQQALELSEFAGLAGVPIARVRRTLIRSYGRSDGAGVPRDVRVPDRDI